MFLARFGSAHLTESLLLFGWGRPEAEWVWSDGKISALAIESVSCAKCSITLSLDASFSLDADARIRIGVNGVDHGERTLAPGPHEVVLEHEAPASSAGTGLVITLFHETCRAPAETSGEDARRVNIALKAIVIQMLAPRRCEVLARFRPNDPATAFFVAREHEGFARETQLKGAVLADSSERMARRALEFYLYGLGGNRHDRQVVWRALLKTQEALGLPPGDLGAPETVEALVSRIAPEFLPTLLKRHDGDGVEAVTLSPEIDNPHYDPVRRFPLDSRLGWMFSERRLPEERVFFTRQAEIVASPRQFLVFDPGADAYYPFCNPAGLTQLSTQIEVAPVDGPVVIACDEFDDSNVAHFLFDCCLRVANFCAAFPGLKDKALFLMNGRPTPLHALAVAALCELHGLNESQIVFPRQPIRLAPRQGAYWFSDLAHDRHPCQRYRPEALAKFTALTRQMAARVAPSPFRAAKIFISRSDAQLRRLANEEALMRRLAPLGVQRIVMSRLSWDEQIDIVGHAEIIVAPHGMGLTLAAFNFRKPRLVEIFHPTVATAAYAMMAKAYGMDYLPVFGVETDPQKLDYALSTSQIEWIAQLVTT